MITILNIHFWVNNVSLDQVLKSATKVNMLAVCKGFYFYVSSNLKKGETARRIASEVLHNPIEILSRLRKYELQMVDEFVKGNNGCFYRIMSNKLI